MRKINKTKLLFGILFLSMCFQNIEILNLGTFGLKLFHVVGVCYLPWLLTKIRYLKLPSKFLTIFLIFMLEISFLNMAKYGLHSLNFNYIFSFYVILLVYNCGETLSKDDWLDVLRKVALIALLAVYINAIMHIDIILNFLKHPWGHPIYTFVFGGGANLEATWIGLFGVFFKDSKKGFIYTALCSVISAMLASRVGIIVDVLCFIVLTFSTTKGKPRYVKKARIIIMMFLALGMVVFFLGTGIIDYLLTRLEAVGSDVGSQARLFMWGNIFKAIENNPFGYGVGNSIVAINTVSNVIITESNVHNLYFQMLLDTGIIGGILYIGTILAFLKKEWKNFFNDSIVAFIILYFLLGFIQFRGGETIMFFIVGIYLASRKKIGKGRRMMKKSNIELKLKSLLYCSHILSLPFYIFRIFPIQKNKIVCSNFYGKGYGDSPRYIIDELLKRDKGYDIVWVVKDKQMIGFPEGVRTVKINSLKYIYELATAKIWIFNSRKNRAIIKRKKQFYIQTWHGGIALKKIEKDAIELDSNYIKQAQEDSKAINLLISNGDFCTQMYQRAFWYSGEILECGTPRNDILINTDKEKMRELVYSFYHFQSKEKVLLYAPTFRDVYQGNPYDIDFENLKAVLDQKTGTSWKILVRLHPNEKNPEKYIQFSENVLNACEYPDIQELILASSLLITDYSSTMFESMIANVDVLLYANDIETYNKERGTYFTFEELPFPLAKNNEELIRIIKTIDFNDIPKEYERFKQRLGLKEQGKASSRICDVIDSIVKG